MMSFTLLAVGLGVLGMSHVVAAPKPRVEREPAPEPVPEPVWQTKSFSSLSQVEAWLDRLERCGVAEKEMSIQGDRTFLVRWRSQTPVTDPAR